MVPCWQLLAVLALPCLVGCVSLQYGDTEAGLVLEDLVTGGRGSRLSRQSEPPMRTGLAYEVDGRQHQADLYTVPNRRAGAGIVLVPGIAAGGKDDRRLVALARTLARARFAVLVPDIPGFRAYRLRAGDVDEIADAVRYLADSPAGYQKPVGIFAISYAVAPAVLACLQPQVRGEARFVVGVAGYYDLQATITFFTTGYYQMPGTERWRWRSPHSYGKWLFLASNAGLLQTASDRRVVRELAWDMLDMQADSEFPWRQPGAEGQTLLDLIQNEDRDQVPALISRLPESIRREMHALNPAAQDLSQLKSRVILLHGRADNIIPFSESVALARAVPQGQGHAYLIDGLAHVNLHPKASDVPVLLDMVQALLEQRDEDGEQ